MTRHNNHGTKHHRKPNPSGAAGLVEPPEEGLSLDSDELGPSFLRYATEQDNFESVRAIPLEFAPPVEPPSDDAPRESATPAANLWERTVEKVSASGEGIDPEKLDDPFEPPPEEAPEERRSSP